MNRVSTNHRVYGKLSQDMDEIDDNSIELVVTSPPYPMVEMWDEILGSQNKEIEAALSTNEANKAFELMHQELDKIWREVARVVIPNGIVCINIGDATRTIDGNFALYSNHSRIINFFVNQGFVNLPNILWRKQTNAPNKFMGSGMLPAGAYVTLEHEWILVFRKGGKREFRRGEERERRRESAFFWEERNVWFSDLWDNIKGTKQSVTTSPESRERSAAYPFEIPYRLINMYSLQGDRVLDPFLGTGTTSLAAMASCRNSIGYEVDGAFAQIARDNIAAASVHKMSDVMLDRIGRHKEFVDERSKDRVFKHYNEVLELPVMTSQERLISPLYPISIDSSNQDCISVTYDSSPCEGVPLAPLSRGSRRGAKGREQSLPTLNLSTLSIAE
ncbi:MAG: site-specific DNA-methyltransferase [Rikenellaceae bacterium]